MSKLTIGKFIGRGAFGHVYHAHWEGRKVAIKKFSLGPDEVAQTAAIQQEVELLQTLVDRHIIQFYGTTHHEGMLVLAMDYAEGGSLQRAINTRRLVDWPTKTRIAQEIVRGLNYIHHKSVLHRDLKSMNVLLTRHMEVKLCDFGLATVKTLSASKSTGSLKGTFRWMAPELFGTKPKYSTKSDMYALAMVMWEIAANCTTPFKGQPDNFAVVVAIKGGEREVLPDDTPAEYRQWVERCWDQDPDKRPEADEMIVDDDADELDGNDNAPSEVTISMSFSSLAIWASPEDTTKDEGANNLSADNGNAILARAKEGDVEAQVALAVKHEKGDGVEQNDIEAFEWYLRAAEKGSMEAQYKVGDFYHHGRGTPVNREAAAHWMGMAAEKGHPQAQNERGWMFLTGFGVERDDEEALSWFHKSAAQNDASAQFNLGWMCYNEVGVKKDYAQALSWYLKSANQGNALAQYSVGRMYDRGFGVDQNYEEAVSWYRKSAEQGNPSAQNSLGVMYDNGLGVKQNYGEALSWYRKSAEQGDAEAQNNIGWMYDKGLGVKPDYSEAVLWYRKAAEQDHASAQNNLGAMYRNGLGVEQDYGMAASLYRKSAKQGNVSARLNLGWMKDNGQVPTD